MAKDPSSKRLASTIQALRKKKGLSQEEYAERSDVHRNYIGFIERAERVPTLKNLVKLAKGFGLKTSELLRLAGL